MLGFVKSVETCSSFAQLRYFFYHHSSFFTDKGFQEAILNRLDVLEKMGDIFDIKCIKTLREEIKDVFENPPKKERLMNRSNHGNIAKIVRDVRKEEDRVCSITILKECPNLAEKIREELILIALEKFGTSSGAARYIGVSRRTIDKYLVKFINNGYVEQISRRE